MKTPRGKVEFFLFHSCFLLAVDVSGPFAQQCKAVNIIIIYIFCLYIYIYNIRSFAEMDGCLPDTFSFCPFVNFEGECSSW